MLTKEQILGMDDLKTEVVKVPEWGCELKVKTITGTDRDAWESSITNSAGKVTTENIRAKLLVRCIVDDAGARLFTDADADALGGKSAAALDRLFTVARKLNGLTKEDVEELAKN